jgi:lysylphosphatidylglycerol synthetase-like protein (DUF2156 family)
VSPPKLKTQKDPTSASPLEKWLKNIGLVISIISGLLALIPQASNLFGSFDHSAEVLLVVCAIGVTIATLSLIRTSTANKRRMGIALFIAVPVITYFLWYALLRVPPDKEQQLEKEVETGNEEKELLHFEEARDHYQKAMEIAPRRGSIRVKLQEAEARIHP